MTEPLQEIRWTLPLRTGWSIWGARPLRQYLKTRCLETIDILIEAHGEIINFIEKKQYDAAIDLLDQCGQGAVKVGEVVAASGGEGGEAVRLLGEYGEAVARFGGTIRAGAPVGIAETGKRLDRMLTDAAADIKDGISTQREVLFLPYKASMWDSLEPVWRRMDKEPDVHAVVMPIPYYDRDAQGRMSQLHYEGTMFPGDVPVVFYGDYDIEAVHPDAIYIHNPYDEANYVTSVAPAYYSSRLKHLTEELVYIPYFILGDIDPSNQGAVEGVEHFITVPAVINAHRVIVQSEDWRKVYINVMTKHAGEETRSYWEQKIEGTGSPKVERVKNLKASDHCLPDAWRRIVERPDGSRKKIIFYNTSVGALLNEGERMLDKIRRVLEIFKDNADEVSLLWRPHPLMEATLASMRPALWEEYEAIVDGYRRSGWGIYDDSPELDRAIAVSDAYYGDNSSVVWLYKETGKPIMIQNCWV